MLRLGFGGVKHVIRKDLPIWTPEVHFRASSYDLQRKEEA